MAHVSDKSCRENQNTNFVVNIFSPRKSYRLRVNVEKYCTAGQATGGSVIQRMPLSPEHLHVPFHSVSAPVAPSAAHTERHTSVTHRLATCEPSSQGQAGIA